MEKSKIIKLFIILGILTGCSTANEASSALILKQTKQFNDSLENINEDKKILILYYDPNNLLYDLNEMIQKKMIVDIYEIGITNNISLEKYDLILIGSIAKNNQPDLELQRYLSQYDFRGKDVSFYWIGDSNYEKYLSSYVNNAKILPSLVLNNNEVSQKELVNALLDGWLTSVYTPIN